MSKTFPLRAFYLIGAVLSLFALAFFTVPFFLSPETYESDAFSLFSLPKNRATAIVATIPPTPTPIIHLKTPKPLRAIYMTACAASSQTLRARIIKLTETTEINAVIINIKDETGKISIPTANTTFAAAYKTAGCPVPDMKQLVEEFHRRNVYTIARIAVFQDPYLVKLHPEWAVRRASDGGIWKDRKGISWLEVKATPVWDYVAALARESYSLGFDEINFDYVRFPSDGNMQDISYRFYHPSKETKAQAVKDFFIGIHDRLKNLGAPISVDLFGMVSTNYDDLGIGQVLEDALPYFDYIAPMVYPSHYPPGWGGYKNPATVPYQVIKYNLDIAVKRAIAASTTPDKIRPWLQDFNLGAVYDAPMIKLEKKAVYDAGLDSWMMWDPKNLYTTEAYLPKQQGQTVKSSPTP